MKLDMYWKRPEMELDLNRLGIEAMIRFDPVRMIVEFKSQDDMHFYKTVGMYEENDSLLFRINWNGVYEIL